MTQSAKRWFERWKHPFMKAEDESPDWIEATAESAAKRNVVLIHPDLIGRAADALTISRAVAIADGSTGPWLARDADLRGEEWYEALPVIVDAEVEWVDGGVAERTRLGPEGRDVSFTANGRADRIVAVLGIRRRGEVTRRRSETDLLIGNADGCANDPKEAGVLVARNSALTAEELAAALREHLFEAAYDDEDDTPPRILRGRYEYEALYRMRELLEGADEATRKLYAEAVRNEMAWTIPPHRTVSIRKGAGNDDVEVSVEVRQG